MQSHLTLNKKIVLLLIGMQFLLSVILPAKQIIEIKPSDGDLTAQVREQLEAVTDQDIEIVFAKGKYLFHPDYAIGRYCAITNHDNGWKKIIFPFENFNSVTINGNGAELIFHGQALPFLFKKCKKVTMKNLTIDWDIPFCVQGEVVASNAKEGWIDLRMFTEGYSWEVKNGRLTFPNIGGFKFSQLGSSLSFDAEHKRVTHGAFDFTSRPRLVENRQDGTLRFHENRKFYPPVGAVLNFKGSKGENRYAPAIQVISSSNIEFENVVVHHAPGMGFLAERSENITLSNCGVFVREGSDRVVSSTADATHFANCKGDILIENCRFENMLDDGTNVHGTYVIVDKVLDKNTLLVSLAHLQQMGFEFAGVGDEVWFIHQPNPQRATVNTIKAVKVLNEQFTELKFENKLPENMAEGDLLENKTWNPSFTMRGCTIQDHRARNIVLKTPEKILIEDNDFSSMMSAVFFRGESFYWFESGTVEDVLIRNNRFEYCAYAGDEHSILRITPRLGKTFDATQTYDRNIRFENNTISTFDNRIVWADRVDGLVIKGNTITQSNGKPLYPDAPLFEFTYCKNIKISDNSYTGDAKEFLKVDTTSQSNLELKNNQGFSIDLLQNKDK